MTDLALPYFLARPAVDPPWPGVVVIHEGNGISAQLLRVCQRLATAGYAAIAPDLFFRAGGSEAGDFATLMGSMRPEQVRADLDGAAATLRALGADCVGVTGFCMGGLLTYRSALEGDTFAAAVGFYGARIAQELGTPRCPTLLLFGGRDPYIPEADIAAVVAHHPETVVYPEATHGFMRDGSESYDEAAATDAWARLLGHFAQHLQS
ncbi:MAG TPA: dienelactone hydrolase family protein [Acidimicrobiia bacterium]|nr:dienelactone hydrolase family protein [Acidimicrobiia bacterium]